MIGNKRGEGYHNLIGIVGFLAVFLAIGIILFRQVDITGKVVQGEESAFSENLKLIVNESGTYDWKIRNPGNIKSLKASGVVSSNGSAKIYVEKDGQKHLLFDSTKQLFDIDISVLPEYKKAFQGDEILIQIVMFNLRGFGSGNVNAKYYIKDGKGNIVAMQEESVFVETQAKFVRKLVIPEEIKPGTYLASVEVVSNLTSVGAGSDTFEIRSKYEEAYPPELKYYAILLAVVVGAAIVIILAMYYIRKFAKGKKIAEITEKEPLEKIEKLEKELKAIEEAYASKYISKDSYDKDRQRIENMLIGLKRGK